MAAARRRNFNEVLDLMLLMDSSSSDSSSDEDLDLLLLEQMIPPERELTNRLNLNDISVDDCEKMFRFEKADMERLLNALQIPDRYICVQGTVATGMESLMIMLRRLTYPNRWTDLVPVFGRTESELSLIFNEIVDDVYNKHEELLTSLDLVWLEPESFSEAIHKKGAALKQCWGFIDGTTRPTARPIRNQKIMFSGHKRIHCLKFQSVQAPNGLIAHMFGPIEGKRLDAFMLGVSGLLPKLRHLTRANGEPYVLYGDTAYGLTRNIIAPFRGANLTANEQQFNSSMSQVRICVEWGFGKVTQTFAYLDFKRNMIVLLQPIAKYYLVATILTNCHTCLYGSQTSSFFNLHPPTLENTCLISNVIKIYFIF